VVCVCAEEQSCLDFLNNTYLSKPPSHFLQTDSKFTRREHPGLKLCKPTNTKAKPVILLPPPPIPKEKYENPCVDAGFPEQHLEWIFSCAEHTVQSSPELCYRCGQSQCDASSKDIKDPSSHSAAATVFLDKQL